MSQVVDSRVVEMRLDNSNFEQNARTSMSTLEKLKQSLNMKGASNGLAAVSDTAKKFTLAPVSKGVDELKMNFSTLEVMANTAIERIANAAIDAGKKMVSAITIDPLKDGLSEYELQIGSTQTIMANTGRNVKDVNKALDQLNDYADLTIYNFSEMTHNAGMFTSAGLGLEDTMVALKGVGNWAAFAGANSTDMSRATYQLGQALNSGSVRLQDWMSIESAAGMAGKKYKEAFVETAKEMGTLDKDFKLKDFRESLKEGWLTTDVFLNTMKKFAANKDMTNAATKVKTFTDAVGTIKEALGTGWATTWRLVIGNFVQARKLWTNVSTTITDIIGKSADARNNLLKGWKQLGGRKDLIASFANAFKALSSVVKPIKEAFREIFPPATAEQLAAITKGLRTFTENLILSDEAAAAVKTVFIGIFSVIKLFIDILTGAVKVSADFFSKFSQVGSVISSVSTILGNFLTNMSKSVNGETLVADTIDKMKLAFLTAFEALESLFKKTKLGSAVSDIFGSLVEILKTGIDTLGGLAENLYEKFQLLDLEQISAIISGGALIKITKSFSEFLSGLGKGAAQITSIGGSFIGVLDSIRGCFVEYQKQIKAEAIYKISKSIAILAVSLAVLAFTDTEKLGPAILAITTLFGELVASFKQMNKNQGEFKKTLASISAMKSIAISVAILAGSLKSVSELNEDELLRAMGAIVALSIVLTKMAKSLGESNMSGLGNVKASIASISVAVKILAEACKDFSELSFEEIGKGVVGIAALLILMSRFMESMDGLDQDSAKIISTGLAMIAVGAAMKIMASACASFAQLSVEELAKGLISIGVALKMLTSIENLNARTGIAYLLIATSLLILAGALKAIGSIKAGELAKALITMGIALGEISGAAMAMTGTLAGAASMLIMAIALNALALSLKLLGSLSLTEIGVAILAMAAAFAVLGIAGALLTPVVPALLSLSAALLGLGLGFSLFGAGVLIFATGMATLAMLAGTGAARIVEFFKEIIVGFLTFKLQIAEGIVGVFTEVVAEIARQAPIIGNAVVKILFVLTDAIRKAFPELLQILIDMLIDILEALRDNMVEFITVGAEVIDKFLEGIGEAWGPFIDQCVILLIQLIEGLADAIDKNADRFADAFVNLIYSAINLLIKTFVKFLAAGKEMVTNLIKGVISNRAKVWSTIKNIMKKGLEAAKSLAKNAIEIGKDFVRGIINGIGSMFSGLINKAKDLAKSAVNAAKSALKIKSPSRVTKEIGEYFVLGFVNGISDNVKSATRKSAELANKATQSFNDAVSNIATISIGDLDFNPTITPVLDLSNVDSGMNAIDNMFGTRTLNVDTSNANAINSYVPNFQNDGANSIVKAIEGLKGVISAPSNVYQVNGGITYDDGSNVATAIKSLVHAVKIEGRV